MQKTSQIMKDILQFLVGVAQTVEHSPATNPYVLHRHLMRQMFSPTYPRRRVGEAISTLKYRGYLQEANGIITLTPKGKQRAQAYRLDELKLDRSMPWDGRWRIVIWDVPEVKRKQRDMVRMILKRVGFVRIQRSIWVTPYPCRDQIQFLRDEVGLTVGLVYLESDFIEDQVRLRRYFNLLPSSVEE